MQTATSSERVCLSRSFIARANLTLIHEPRTIPGNSHTCHARTSTQGAESAVKLVAIFIGSVFGMAVLSGVAVTFFRARDEVESSLPVVDDDTRKADDEGAIMADRKMAEGDSGAVRFQDVSGEEEGLARTLVRTLVPSLVRSLFGLEGNPSRISFGNTEVSGSTIDI